MKRYGDLWDSITSFENLLLAARKAQKAKRYQSNVLAFNTDLDRELLSLRSRLMDQDYEPGPYRTFEIHEPKQRMISAAPYRDRVVHHALCNVIGPLFDKGFILDNYANRQGKGTHRALRRFTEFLRSSRYVLKCDIRKYFPSIDHEILKDRIRRKIKCQRTLWLIDTIIDASNPQPEAVVFFPGDTLWTPYERRRGLPIGNLTSQFFANIYLDGLDHYVKEQMRCAKYLRYVDDFALFHDDQDWLRKARDQMARHLEHVRLIMHPHKTLLSETRRGACFVGFLVQQDQIRIRPENLRRGKSRLKEMQWSYRRGEIPWAKVRERIRAWMAHLAHGNTWRLRKRLLADCVFQRRA